MAWSWATVRGSMDVDAPESTTMSILSRPSCCHFLQGGTGSLPSELRSPPFWERSRLLLLSRQRLEDEALPLFQGAFGNSPPRLEDEAAGLEPKWLPHELLQELSQLEPHQSFCHFSWPAQWPEDSLDPLA